MRPRELSTVPWLVDRLARFLTKKDLLTCLVLSKSFHQGFSRAFWMRLILPPANPTVKTKVLARTLSKYGHLVKELTYESRATERFYNVVAANCHALTSIKISTCDARLWGPLVSVLEHNPDITTLHYEEQAAVSSGHEMHELVKGLTQLRELKLDLVTPLTWTDLMQLGHLCPNLGRLEISTAINPATCNVIEDPLVQDSGKHSEVASEQISATRFANLEALCIHCIQDDKVFSMLLGHCPSLKTLEFVLAMTMTLTIRSLGRDCCCPDLQSITAKNSMGVTTDGPLAAIIRACPPGHLEHLEVHNGHVGAQTFRAIVAKHAATLKMLRLIDLEQVDGHGLGSIFAHCCRLEGLEVTLQPEARYAPEIVDCRHLLRSPWVCLNLKTLCVPAGWPMSSAMRWVDIRVTRNTLQFRRTERAFYTQLGKLTNLRELRIPCHNKSPGRHGAVVRASGLSWTMQGLNEMRALSKLEVFDIGQFEHGMTFEELRWMYLHWPQLKVLGARGTWRQTDPDDEDLLAGMLLLTLQLLAAEGAIDFDSDDSDDSDGSDSEDGSGLWETDPEAYSSDEY
ncbi:hypothetical protein DFQ27_002283 [Actinomortierella ambigua]|uniref:F-box domain-containing protein n=1 Tax=Actinomortierella ambigua TaxID=1343610 RepID=A0A9P6QCD8_9FUNG|nr:hypothetical protein DFQ27_002283 [Actinomortierella ambigua]